MVCFLLLLNSGLFREIERSRLTKVIMQNHRAVGQSVLEIPFSTVGSRQ